MRKLLFLDFDGVLHPSTVTAEQPLFCRAALLVEASALAQLDFDIVISSSWRHHFSLQALLEPLPSAIREKVVGTTGPAHIGKWSRFQEIQRYRMQHGNPPWRALDDSRYEFPPDCAELIWCNPNYGLVEADGARLKKWLSAAWEPGR